MIWKRESMLALESFWNQPRLHVNMLCDQSPDPALNCNIRPLSMADSKSSLEKGGGYCTEHLATREWLREQSISQNRPLSALNSILETLHELSRDSFGIVVFFPFSSQPESCPESCDSLRISARQEIVS